MEIQINDIKSEILYCIHENYYNLLLNRCKLGISKFKTEVSFQLYQAIALYLNNRFEECVNNLESLKDENDVKLSVTIALIYSHKLLNVTNNELFSKLEFQMNELYNTTTYTDFYHSAFVFYVFNEFEKAFECIEKCIDLQDNFDDALVLKGWIMLKLNRQDIDEITNIFHLCIKRNSKNLDAFLGIIDALLLKSDLIEALNIANTIIIRFPLKVLSFIAKLKVEFAMHDWEQLRETIARILNSDSDNLDALKIQILVLICQEGNYMKGFELLEHYFDLMKKKEPKNGLILLKNAQLFSKICGKNNHILSETFRMIEQAVLYDSNNEDFIVELGMQCIILERIKDAIKYFNMAINLNNSHLKAYLGLTLCELIENGKTPSAEQHIEFISKHEESQSSSLYYFILAKISDNSESALEYLHKVIELQLDKIKVFHYTLSDTYLTKLNPNFMLDVIKETMQYFRIKSNVSQLDSFKLVKKTLNLIIKACPGLYEASYLLAKLQYLSGDVSNALRSLEKIMNNIELIDGYLLMAQIQIEKGYYEKALQSLEVGLSYNFQIRENPLYYYIRAMADKNTNNLNEAVQSLTMAMSIINSNENNNQNNTTISLSEKASIYIELIQLNNDLGQIDESLKLLEEATEKFKDTTEESRIILFNCEQEIIKKNIQEAIDLLKTIKITDSYYLKAKIKLADILLNYRKDKYAYLECYQELVNENPSIETYLLMGDAYMNILEPDDALNCYKTALNQNPKDPYLNLKMGKALVDTHYFKNAVKFYKESIKSVDDIELKLQLGNLYLQLKEYEEAENLLNSELDNNYKDENDLNYLQHKIKLLLLLAESKKKLNKLDEVFSTLQKAKDNQNRVIKRSIIEQSEIPQNELTLSVEICSKLAETAVSLKNNDQAIQLYKDALEMFPNNINIMINLAKLYTQISSLDLSQQVCSSILKIDAENETASLILADIAFRKTNFDIALFHFTQLIIKQPNNWTALVRLIEIMKRLGNLDDAPEYLKNAELNCSNQNKEAGLIYCTALYQWYFGNLNGALRNFNIIRQDIEWGIPTLFNMIEICLNPDDDVFNEQIIDYDTEYRDSRTLALKTTEKLLNELHQRVEYNTENMFKYRMYVNLHLLAKAEKLEVETALNDFISLASQNEYKNHPGPIIGMAMAYTLLKQTQRAKNQLKRLVKTAWIYEYADYLEKAWLLLADYYIQSTKYEIAGDQLRKILNYNKSCKKAYEYMGYIAEKEQHYKDAVSYYESAWRYSGKTNANVGYKLAYNYMKSKRYADAIDVGQQVLKLNPNIPRLKKDILDKSINNLRI